MHAYVVFSKIKIEKKVKRGESQDTFAISDAWRVMKGNKKRAPFNGKRFSRHHQLALASVEAFCVWGFKGTFTNNFFGIKGTKEHIEYSWRMHTSLPHVFYSTVWDELKNSITVHKILENT